jgi:hypothetical protein
VNILNALRVAGSSTRSGGRWRGRRRSLKANVLVADRSGRAIVLAAARARLGGETSKNLKLHSSPPPPPHAARESMIPNTAPPTYSRLPYSIHVSLSLSRVLPLRDVRCALRSQPVRTRDRGENRRDSQPEPPPVARDDHAADRRCIRERSARLPSAPATPRRNADPRVGARGARESAVLIVGYPFGARIELRVASAGF